MARRERARLCDLSPRACAALLAVPLVLTSACRPEPLDSRPSLLLIVIDTLRADAVSAYGEVKATTPQIDALASEGILYRRAYAPAPWTLPSHATILSGLSVDQHRVGMPGRGQLPEEVTTLAERLKQAGYQTAGFSENSMVSDPFQLLQGYDHRVTNGLEPTGETIVIDVYEEIKHWLARRTSGEPFLVFVNLMDPHMPYEVHKENPFVPPHVPRSGIGGLSSWPNRLICGGLPSREQIDGLFGLYLGEVRIADAKVGRIVRALRAEAGARGLVTVVTSDHGEYFGEDRLMGHEFGLHDAVLRVPLVVHGLPGVPPTVVPETVGLIDLAPSLLAWAGVEGDAGLPGIALPLKAGAPRDRSIFAAYSDTPYWMPEQWKREFVFHELDKTRQFCSPSDPVWGAMASLVHHPFKFRWFERYPPALYDLRWDPEERSNLAEERPELVEQFTEALTPLLRSAGLDTEQPVPVEPLPEAALETLRALGYLK